MADKETVLVGPMKVGAGQNVDPTFTRTAAKTMLNTAMKSFRGYNAVKATKEKSGYHYKAVLTKIKVDGGKLGCAIEGKTTPIGKLKPIIKATNSGELPGGGVRDADGLVSAVIAAQVAETIKNFKRLK